MLMRKSGKTERNSPTKEALYVLGAALERRAVGLVGDVAVEDLVGDLEVALIKDLLGVASEGGLDLFFGGHFFSLPSHPASFRAGRSTTDVATRRGLAHLVKVYSPK